MCGSGSSGSKGVLKMLVRISLGLSLLLMGAAHYLTLDGFTAMVSEGLGPIAPLGMLWAYVLPLLFIVGGVLLVIGMYKDVAAWVVGIGLGSIMPGLLLKTVIGGVPLDQAMNMGVPAALWLVLLLLSLKKGGCCSGPCGSSCGCGSASCNCGTSCNCGSADCPECGPKKM